MEGHVRAPATACGRHHASCPMNTEHGRAFWRRSFGEILRRKINGGHCQNQTCDDAFVQTHTTLLDCETICSSLARTERSHMNKNLTETSRFLPGRVLPR